MSHHSRPPGTRGGAAAFAVALAVALALVATGRASAAGSEIRPHESYSGYYYLDMGSRGTGDNAYAGVRFRPGARTLVYAQIDYLARFDRGETKILAGASLGVAGGWSFAAEVAVSPRAELYPTTAGWMEAAKVSTRSLVLYLRAGRSVYEGASLSVVSLAGEYYPPRVPCAVISRASVSTNDFGGDTRSTVAGGLLKVIWFAGERSRVFGYGAVGSESYRLEIAERIGSLYANTVGAGADYYPRPALKISPSLEYQDRERGPRFLQAGLEIGVLW